MVVCMRSREAVSTFPALPLLPLQTGHLCSGQSCGAVECVDPFLLLLHVLRHISHQSPDTSHRMNYDPRTRSKGWWYSHSHK